jgi:FKBP-type peptidyl-prolyl cis-trans isomerase SlyD
MEQELAVVTENVVVSLDYELTVDGAVIDSSAEAPLEYLHGHGNIIVGLENALMGMVPGETKMVTVAPEDAYGKVDPEAFVDLERGQFPPNFPVEIGRALRLRTDEGTIRNGLIAEINGDDIRVDLNHPLAGKELLFRATIVGLRPATEDEVRFGRVGGCSSCGSSGGCGGSCG